MSELEKKKKSLWLLCVMRARCILSVLSFQRICRIPLLKRGKQKKIESNSEVGGDNRVSPYRLPLSLSLWRVFFFCYYYFSYFSVVPYDGEKKKEKVLSCLFGFSF